MIFSSVILAAGSSTRMNGIKKQFFEINCKKIVEFSVQTFLEVKSFEIIVVVDKESLQIAENCLKRYKKIKIVVGGETRQQSSKIGFKSSSEKSDFILFHDAARPFVKKNKIEDLLKIVEKYKAATLACFPSDTVKTTDGLKIEQTLNRNKIALIQTPQAFCKKLYGEALKFNESKKKEFTDDCQLIEQLGHNVFIVESDSLNFKITTSNDLKLAKILAEKLNL